MNRLLKIFVIAFGLLFAQQAYAFACVAGATGAWNSAATWTSCNSTYPQNGDTATVGGGFTVTVTNGTTMTVGTDPVTSTNSTSLQGVVTIQGTGILTVNGTLYSRGDVVVQRGGRLNGGPNGILYLDSASGTKRYRLTINNTGSGNAVINFAGTAGNMFTINGDGGRSGLRGWIDLSQGVNNFYGSYSAVQTKMLNLGDATVQAFISYQLQAGVIHTMTNVLVSGCGQFYVYTVNGGISWNGVDFRNIAIPRSTGFFLYVNDNNVINANARTLTNITVYSPTVLVSSYMQIHAATLSNWVTYNNVFAANAYFVNSTVTGYFAFTDVAATPQVFATPGNSNNTFQDSILISRFDNQHFFEETVAGNTTGANTYRRNVFDGDNYYGTDAGDIVLPTGPISLTNNLNINGAGTLVTLFNANAAAIINSNTSYKSYGVTLGETVGAATQVTQLQNNLFATQPDGMHQASAAVSQSGFTMDYNGFFGMGSGAHQTCANITHPVLSKPSYLCPASPVAYWTAGSFGQTGKGLHDVYANPNFIDPTRTVRTYGGWADVVAGAREMVTMNGFDYTGAAATATTKTVTLAQTYISAGFVPSNVLLKGTGLAGADIGAFPVSTGTGKLSVVPASIIVGPFNGTISDIRFCSTGVYGTKNCK